MNPSTEQNTVHTLVNREFVVEVKVNEQHSITYITETIRQAVGKSLVVIKVSPKSLH